MINSIAESTKMICLLTQLALENDYVHQNGPPYPYKTIRSRWIQTVDNEVFIEEQEEL